MDHPEPEQKNKRRALGLKHAQEIAKEVVRPPDALRMEKKLLQSDEIADGLSNHCDVHWKSGRDVEDKNQSSIDKQNMPDNPYGSSVQPASKVLIPMPQGEQVTDSINGISNKSEDLKNLSTTETNKFHKGGIIESGEENAKNIASINILAKTQLNVNAPEFISSQKGPFVNSIRDSLPDDSFATATGTGEYYFVTGLLQDTVNTLTFSPGHYDAIIDNLLETLQMFISTAETMEGIVHIIIEQAIESSNFLYTAVKLIKVFLENLVIAKEDSTLSFKDYFYKCLRKVFLEMPNLIKDRDNQMSHSRAFGIVMLFADLLCNVKTQQGELNIAFSKAVFSNIDLLMKEPTKEMVETLIKLMKLTGPTLDQHKSEVKNTQDVNEIFEKFRELSCDSTWLSHLDNNKDLRAKVLGLYKMHTRDWDRTPAQPVEDFNGLLSASAAHDDQATPKIDWNEYYGPEDLDGGEEYGDEFEIFLKESGQI